MTASGGQVPRIIRILIAVVIAIAAAFVPLKTLSCPAWDVLVTDRSGHPVSEITVRLIYQNFSAESEGHEADAITDAQGCDF
jgi:hypothetical protein